MRKILLAIFFHYSLRPSSSVYFLRETLRLEQPRSNIGSYIAGADGGLDFAVLKVLDETKQTCSLKNKGKFEINFNFAFESTDGSPADVAQLFTVIPNRGPLLPTDRPTQVQVIFRSKSEITIKDQPILKCQVSIVFSPVFFLGGGRGLNFPPPVNVYSQFSPLP